MQFYRLSRRGVVGCACRRRNSAPRAGLTDEAESEPAMTYSSNMITLEDCIGLCGLTEEEVLALAEHEHLPEIAPRRLPGTYYHWSMAAKKLWK